MTTGPRPPAASRRPRGAADALAGGEDLSGAVAAFSAALAKPRHPAREVDAPESA
jgi:hypothetical protein